MKCQKLFTAFCILAVLAYGIPALATTSFQEKENNYQQAVFQLESYLEAGAESKEELKILFDAFIDLAGYEQSKNLGYYVSILRKAADGEYDFILSTYLDILSGSDAFRKYTTQVLYDSPIGTIEDLNAYISARENEQNGNYSQAAAYYKQCLHYFDASERYLALSGKVDESYYNQACQLIRTGDYAGAYFLFSEISGYKDSKDHMDSIVRQIGYTPSSPTDNLKAPSGLRTQNTTTTQISLAWSEVDHAQSYNVSYKKQYSSSSNEMLETTDTQATISGLAPNTTYEFLLVSKSGTITSDAASVTAQTKAEITPTPKPTPTKKPTAKPTPKRTPTPIPTFAIYATRIAKVRSDARSDAPEVGTVQQGEILQAYDVVPSKEGGKDWYKIKYNGRTAYISCINAAIYP